MGQKSAKADEVTDGSTPLQGRQETFCQVMAGGKVSGAEAYRQAGYSEIGANGHSARLVAKGSIKRRTEYIQAERAAKEGISREGQTRKLVIVAERCLAAGEHSTYVRAIEATNRMYGLDKQVIETHTEQPMTRSDQEQADLWAEFRLWEASRRGPGNVIGIRDVG